MGRRLFDGASRDVRLALRALRGTPVVAFAAVSSLALGIGANIAIFSIINGLVLRTLPVRDPERLVLLTDASTDHVRVWSYPIWREVHHRADLFEQSAAWSFTRFNLASGGETQLVDGMWASGSFFETLGVPALLGRTLSEADDRAGGSADGPVAVIGYAFWQRAFGAAPDVVGRNLIVDGMPFTIVGVTPPDFSGPEVGRAFDVLVPIAYEPLVRARDSFVTLPGTTFLTIVARLKPGQSLEAATAGLRRVQAEIREATLPDSGLGRFGSRSAFERYLKPPFVLVTGATGYAGARDLRSLYERPLLTVMAIVVLLLLIACVNVANLMTARALGRQHELSVRIALGASRWRLVRQLLADSAVLCGLGTALGLPLATWGARLLVRELSTPGDPIFLEVSPDSRVLAFTVVIAVATILLFGTAPAFRASGAEPIDALKQHGRLFAGRAGRRLGGWLIVAQVAVSLVLVVAAGLFVRTLSSLTRRPLGFDPAHVLVISVDAHRIGDDQGPRVPIYERAREVVRRVPGVAHAALSLTTPLGGGQFTPPLAIEGITDTRGPVWSNLITPGWLATFRTPLITGRDITDGDRAGAPRVAIVNQAFARKFTPGGTPIGRTFTLYPGTTRALGPVQVVGVVGDAVYTSLRAPAPPTCYLPMTQFDYLANLGIRSINLSVRTETGAPMQLTRALTAALATVDPRLDVTFRPLAEHVQASLAQERLVARLAGCFGALALLLAGFGLYGVTSYAVATRRPELALRIALGASAASVTRLVVAGSSLLVGSGLIIGAGASLWAATFVRALIYGIEPRDPLSVLVAAAVLAGVAGLSAWIPARRAARMDPAAVLRES